MSCCTPLIYRELTNFSILCLEFVDIRTMFFLIPKDRQHFGYLTAEQALADYVLLINQLKANYSCFASSPVIAFGGSYGGMLSAWIRQKYPNQIAG